jgi:hypothetical protein
MNSATDRPETQYSSLTDALAFLQRQQPQAPPAQDLVADLLKIEKHAKQQKQRYAYSQLLGNWRLRFITGTVKARKQAGVALGPGRFLPQFLKIQIRYAATDLDADRGTVQNSVSLGALKLQLTGPTQFWPKTNSLAFDFTHLQISIGKLTLYQGGVRGGEKRTAAFYEETLKDQAFFTYFAVQNTHLAARGRGGGLALWTRAEAE